MPWVSEGPGAPRRLGQRAPLLSSAGLKPTASPEWITCTETFAWCSGAATRHKAKPMAFTSSQRRQNAGGIGVQWEHHKFTSLETMKS